MRRIALHLVGRQPVYADIPQSFDVELAIADPKVRVAILAVGVSRHGLHGNVSDYDLVQVDGEWWIVSRHAPVDD